jgi:hypothetical protein
MEVISTHLKEDVVLSACRIGHQVPLSSAFYWDLGLETGFRMMGTGIVQIEWKVKMNLVRSPAAIEKGGRPAPESTGTNDKGKGLTIAHL